MLVRPIMHRAAGGHPGFVNGILSGLGAADKTLEYVSLVTDSNGVAYFDLLEDRSNTGYARSQAYGYFAGDNFATTTRDIEKFTFTTSVKVIAGDLQLNTYVSTTGMSSQSHGYIGGGQVGAGAVDDIEKWTFATDANSTTVGILTGNRNSIGGHSDLTGQKGHITGGWTTSGSSLSNNDKVDFTTDTNATAVSALTNAVRTHGATSSITHAYLGGGVTGTSTLVNDLQKFLFSNEATKSSVGTISSSRSGVCGISGYEIGKFCAGTETGLVLQDNIDKFTYATDTSNGEVAQLTEIQDSLAGVQY